VHCADGESLALEKKSMDTSIDMKGKKETVLDDVFKVQC